MNARRALLGWGIATAALLFVLGACDVYNFDVGGHIAKGRWILEHRELPRPEVFVTSKEPGFVYTDRWLFQVVCWIVYKTGGWTGLTLVKIAFLCLTFGLLWSASRPAGPLACAFASLLAALLMYERWDIRSELSVYLFVAASLALVGDGKTGKWIWLAPAVVAIGINSHALVLLAPCVIAMAAVAVLFRPDTRPRAKTFGLAAVASFAALVCNPQGFKVVAVPFEYLNRYRTGPDWYKGWITELHSVTDELPWPSVSLIAVKFVVPFAILAAALNWRRLRAFDVGLLFLGALAGFSYRRNVAVAGLLLLPVIARNLHEAALDLAGRLRARGQADLLPRAHAAGGAALALAFAVTAALSSSDLWATWERSSRRAGFGISRITLPVDACDFLDREGYVGNAYLNWDAGAYYTLRRFPASVPTMNAEGDWSLVTLGEYDRVSRGEIPFEDYAAKYSLELAVLSHQSSDTRDIIRSLAASSDWVLVHRDECAVVFARRAGPNADRVRKFETKKPAPVAVEPREPGGGIWPWKTGRARAEAVRQYRIGTMYALFEEDDAAACYRRAIDLWPEYPEAHNNLGAWMGTKGLPGADDEFRRAIELAPDYARSYSNLASYYRERNNLSAAEQVLEQGTSEVKDARLLTELGWMRLVRGLKVKDRAALEAARDSFQRALKLRPGLPVAVDGLQKAEAVLR